MLVLLDTTAVMSDFTFGGPAWRVLAHAPSEWNLEIFVTEVVLMEAVAGYERQVAKAAGELSSLSKALRRLGLPDADHVIGHAPAEAVESYKKRLGDFLSELNVVVLPSPDVPHRVLVDRATRRLKPCDGDGNGYRDTLNWLTLVELVRERKDQNVVWISNNSSDFGAGPNSEELHPDLLADLAEIDGEERVGWLRNLASLALQLAAIHSSEAIDDLRQIADDLQSQTVVRYLNDVVSPNVLGLRLDPRACALPRSTRSARVVGLIHSGDPTYAVRGSFGVGEAVAEFTFTAEVIIELESEAAEDNEQTTTRTVTKELIFGGLVTLDRQLRPQSAEVITIDALPGDPGAAAWAPPAAYRFGMSTLPPDFFKNLIGPTLPPDYFKNLIGPTFPPDYFKNLIGPTFPPDYFKNLIGRRSRRTTSRI